MILGMVFATTCGRALFVMPDVTCTNMNQRIYKYKQQSAQPFESGLIFLDPTTPSTTRNTDKHTLVYSKESLHWCKADQKLAARIICGAGKFDHVTVPLKELRRLPNKSQLKSVTQNSPPNVWCLRSCILLLEVSITRFNKWSHVFKLVTFSNPHISLNSKSGQRPFYYPVVRLQSMGWDYHI